MKIFDIVTLAVIGSDFAGMLAGFGGKATFVLLIGALVYFFRRKLFGR